MHTSNQLIDSFRLTYSPKSCEKENLSIPLEPHHKAQSSEIFLRFRQKIKRAVIFYLLGNPAETPYLSVRDGKLSNTVRLVEFRPRKVAVHTFLGGPKRVCSDGLRAGTIHPPKKNLRALSYPYLARNPTTPRSGAIRALACFIWRKV